MADLIPATARDDVKIIDVHDTWSVVNPIVGCPAACAYCYLEDLGLTRTRPVELATPEETADLLLADPRHRPTTIYALYTYTDALSTPKTRAHLIGLLRALVARAVRNPVCIITKFHVTDAVLGEIVCSRAAGLPVLVYLSYSGLGRDIERGIHHDLLRANFPRLREAAVPVLHYWRPALPANSTPEAMRTVLSWASTYADATISVGLKVKPSARDQAADLWPALADPGLDLHAAESIWPEAMRTFLSDLPSQYAHHPIFETNSCALAYVLGRADRAGVHGTPTCTRFNRCPDRQRGRCTTLTSRRAPLTHARIRGELAAIGRAHVPYTWDAHTLTLAAPLAMRDQHFLSQALAVAVRAPRHPGDPMWSGKAAGGLPLVIPNHNDERETPGCA
ncbi:hypothetical protein P3T27_007517 [Kitasatospora sp. MAA19]|uniref:hypothetical protein n=1 Tax=unclassified Kitasatospora TaxID=2633591 RepID=UPI002474A3A1|nr:hypothetical protein [Kitasatospora sp. MAA19]MDH6710766.1 hypothetical protein [Kitasatospora sp. MAA19]